MLGLDDSTWSPQGIARFRASDRWRIELEYFEVNRSRTKALGQDLTWGDFTFPAGSQVTADYDVSVARLSAGYSFFRTPDKELGIGLGFHITDIEARLETSGGSAESGKVLAPLPVVSLYGQVALTDTWAVSSRLDVFRLEYEPYKGNVSSIGLDLMYQRSVISGSAGWLASNSMSRLKEAIGRAAPFVVLGSDRLRLDVLLSGDLDALVLRALPCPTSRRSHRAWFDSQARSPKFYAGIRELQGHEHHSPARSARSQRPPGSVGRGRAEGQSFTAMNGGPCSSSTRPFPAGRLRDARGRRLLLGEALLAATRSEQCGWLKDKYGVSWQVVPSILPELLKDAESEKSKRVMKALLQMQKLDIAALKRAYAG